jgi:hypothetical protein
MVQEQTTHMGRKPIGQHTPLALFLPQPHRLQASTGIPLDYGYFILFYFVLKQMAPIPLQIKINAA